MSFSKPIVPYKTHSAHTYGMTSPISLDPPTQSDLEKTVNLEKTLEQFNIFESESEMKHRIDILMVLNTLVEEWVKQVSRSQNMPKESVLKVGGRIYTFGSYRLGVHQKGADIDALCVVPRNIDHKHFFTTFYKILCKQPETTDCRAIPDAFVPVIKLTFDGIEVDLLFARLALPSIPEDLELNDSMLLKNLDQRCVRSLNGCRVTDEILRSVPDKDNFRITLRTIKLWAKRNGVYSNALGYFGGVTWGILVARICQLYPNATPATIVHKFFLVLSKWEWPRPILLKRPAIINLNLPVWDPRINLGDREHLMPIITPAYPEQNTTYNVSHSTRTIITNEIARGKTIIDEIMVGNQPWSKLFEPSNFFYKYRHFIVLLVSSNNTTDQVPWAGLVESKIRLFVSSLERNPHINLAHVNPKSYSYEEDKIVEGNGLPKSDGPCSMWFIGLDIKKIEGLNLDLTETTNNFIKTVYKQAFNTKQLKVGLELRGKYVHRKKLNQYISKDLLVKDKIVPEKRSNSNDDSNEKSDEITDVKKKRKLGQ